MTVRTLYGTATGMADILSMQVSTGHSFSTASAFVKCRTPSVGIGDQIEIDLGYDDYHTKIFQGFIKTITREVPDNVYTIVAKDDLIRAVDYFIVPTNPDDPFKRHNISAEDLVEDILNLASLTNFTFEATSFTFATKSGNDVEVKLVSAYDFCKMISDLLAWHLWADSSGLVHFENRKPYVMDGTSGQPGDITPDVSIGTLSDADILQFTYGESDRDLRNRVVVHGAEGIYAEASAVSPYLPAGFYKSAALVSPIIDNQGMAQNAADYNLALFNNLTVSSTALVLGNPDYIARNVITVNELITGTTGDWYIFLAEHQWSKTGYVCNLELRQ